MTRINELSRLDNVQNGDLLPVWATSKGDDRAAAMSVLLSYMQNNLSFPRDKATQREEPSAAFSITVKADTSWLLLRPTGTIVTGTVILPSEPKDQDEVTISTTQNITLLTISSNVVSIPRPAGPLDAHHGLTMKYDAIIKNWFVTSAP